MDWVWFLFGFEGRINRANFFLAGGAIQLQPHRASPPRGMHVKPGT
jgi:hypothetical protein